jgi:N-acetylmuramoyl-L-alanine amidase
LILALSPNFDGREGADVAFLVLHYTGMRSCGEAVARLRDPAAKVSSHYVVDEDGTVYALVGEENRAWHAGVSYWRGVRGLNDRSVGIEIVNPGPEWGSRGFPLGQLEAVRDLCRGVLGRWPGIEARNVVGHSDIAPDRKQDPGELFPWAWLAGQGVGVWTDEMAAPGDFWDDLAAIGYDTTLPDRLVITAFQRHFLPGHLSGEADEKTAGRAAGLRALVDGAG